VLKLRKLVEFARGQKALYHRHFRRLRKAAEGGGKAPNKTLNQGVPGSKPGWPTSRNV